LFNHLLYNLSIMYLFICDFQSNDFFGLDIYNSNICVFRYLFFSAFYLSCIHWPLFVILIPILSAAIITSSSILLLISISSLYVLLHIYVNNLVMMVVYIQVYPFPTIAFMVPSVCLYGRWRHTLMWLMIRMKESGNLYFLPFLFSFILARSSSQISSRSYEKRISPRLTRGLL